MVCAWRHHAITWTNWDLKGKVFSDIHLHVRVIPQEMPRKNV